MNGNVMTGVYTFKGKEEEFSFYNDISMTNKIKFVKSVTDYIVGDSYNSIIRNLIFDFEIIDIFTDIDLTEILNLSQTDELLDMIEVFVNETEIAGIVKSNMVSGLLDELNIAVDDNITYLTGVHRDTLSYALSHFLNIASIKLNEVDMKNLMEASKKINDISGKLTADKILTAYKKAGLVGRK